MPTTAGMIALHYARGRRYATVGGMTQRAGPHGVPYERITVAQAAERLGISEPAVRARIRRGTLQADHTPEGVRVYVTPDDTPRGTTDAAAHIADLRDALDAERRAHSETRRLLAAALERIPALPPPEASEDHVQDAEPAGERTLPRPRKPAILRPYGGRGGVGCWGVACRQ